VKPHALLFNGQDPSAPAEGLRNEHQRVCLGRAYYTGRAGIKKGALQKYAKPLHHYGKKSLCCGAKPNAALYVLQYCTAQINIKELMTCNYY
jgi:hypothetical protein